MHTASSTDPEIIDNSYPSYLVHDDTDTAAESSGHPYARNFYKSLTTTSVIADLIFVVFMFNAIYEAITTGLDESGIESEFVETLLLGMGYMFSGMNVVCDTIAVNPIEDAEDLLSSSASTLDTELKDAGKCESIATKALAWFNQLIAQISYISGAPTDALGFAYLASNNIFRLGTGIPVVLLGVIYYNMLTRVAINEHAHELVRRISAKESTLVKAIKSPAKSLEVLIQSLSNGLYRGVAFGYVMEQVLVTIFGKQEDDASNVYFISAAALTTLYITLFSRTLNVHRKVFNDAKCAKTSRCGSVIDWTLSILRGVPLSIMVYRYGTSSPVVDYALSGILGALVTGHSLYVRYSSRLCQAALHEMTKERLLPIEATPKSSEELFNAIQERLKTDNLRRIVTIFNACGRISRSVAFFGFLTVLNESFKRIGIDFKIDFLSIVCLHQLWGNTTLENEASFYQKFLEENASYYLAKIVIHKTEPGVGCLSLFWKAKKDLPEDCLRRVLKIMDENKQLLLSSPSDDAKRAELTSKLDP